MSDSKEHGKIYRRDTLLKNTKLKKKDEKNRKILHVSILE